MAKEIPGFTRSYEPSADLSASYLKFVRLNGAVISPVTAAGGQGTAVGVLQNKPTTNAAVLAQQPALKQSWLRVGTVMITGVTRALAADAFAAGVQLRIAADGSVTGNQAGAGPVIGISEDASTGAGSVVTVLLKPLAGVA